MKGKILDAWYEETDDELNESCICKETKYGTFTGYARPAEQDKDIANSWDGFRFAETKCDIQAYKARAKVMKERANGISHALRVVLTGNPQYAAAPAIEKLIKQEAVAWKNYRQAKEQYEIMRDSYSGFCEQIIKQRRKIRDK